jgi:hypothetical protein
LYVGLVSLAACDGIAPADYAGEPLATVRGQVLGGDEASLPDDLEVVLVFVRDDLELMYVSAFARGDLEPLLPNRFELSVFQPPPAEIMTELPGAESGRAATASVAVVDGDDLVLATSVEQVVYFDANASSAEVSALYGAPVSPGYHLTWWESAEATEAQRASCREAFTFMMDESYSEEELAVLCDRVDQPRLSSDFEAREVVIQVNPPVPETM